MPEQERGFAGLWIRRPMRAVHGHIERFLYGHDLGLRHQDQHLCPVRRCHKLFRHHPRLRNDG